uniref:Uncharacterized protein n=1 Tax=Timema bartmani TaxID=61472 RepID=A0A7R9F610_9NEOP|nr:unnamed protein product [Timema bartmani]
MSTLVGNRAYETKTCVTVDSETVLVSGHLEGSGEVGTELIVVKAGLVAAAKLGLTTATKSGLVAAGQVGADYCYQVRAGDSGQVGADYCYQGGAGDSYQAKVGIVTAAIMGLVVATRISQVTVTEEGLVAVTKMEPVAALSAGYGVVVLTVVSVVDNNAKSGHSTWDDRTPAQMWDRFKNNSAL